MVGLFIVFFASVIVLGVFRVFGGGVGSIFLIGVFRSCVVSFRLVFRVGVELGRGVVFFIFLNNNVF